jgi:tetratricopeptide (TPR) repeat protein
VKPPHRLLAGGCLAGLIVLLLAASPGTPATTPENLLSWDAQEWPITAGQRHTRQITVEPGTAILITVDQHSIDLVIEARGPALPAPITVAAGNDRWGAEVLLLEAPGDYEIRLRPLKKSTWPGSYLIRAESAPPSSDPRRNALALMSRAGQEVYLDTAEARAQAIADYREALTIWNALGDRLWQTETLVCLSFQDSNRSDLPAAKRDIEAALKLWGELGQPRREAEALNWLGWLTFNTEGAEKARPYLEKAGDLWNRLGQAFDSMETRNNLCTVDRKLGALSTALACYQEVQRFFQEKDVQEQEALAFQNIGGVHDLQGNLDGALADYHQSLALSQKLEDRNGQATTLNNIAAVYRKQGKWQEALRTYNESLPLLPPDDDVLRVRLLNNIGYAYDSLGAPERARPYFEQASGLFQKIGDRSGQITGLNNLGSNARRLGDLKKALEFHQRALDLARALGEKAQQAASLSGLAGARLDGDEGAEALRDIDAALALRKGSEERPPEVALLHQRGRALILTGRLSDGRAALQDALEKRRALHDPAGEIETLVALGGAERDLGLTAEARGHVEAAIEGVEALRTGLTSPELRAAFFATRHRAFALLIDLLMDLDAAEPGRGHDSAAFAVSERARARTLLDALHGEPAPPPPSSPEEISKGLDKGTILLEYSLGDRRSFLWTVDDSGRLCSAVLPGRSELETLARRVYAEMKTVQAGAGGPGKAAESLSRKLLGPVWAGSALPKRLVVVPDGALGLVPFAALPVPPYGSSWKAAAGRKLLLEYLETVSIPSATTLAAERRRTHPPGPGGRRAAILADPVYRAGDPLTPAFDPLPATRHEAQAIAELAPPGEVEVRLGPAASREAVLSGALRGDRILHFATHAVADMATPERSGLVLSQVDVEGHSQEGFLGLADLYGLDLDADLVVLSACDTALGKEVRGEGLMSLTRGFQSAGVPRVVASLWRAPDRATAELMPRFYREMWLNNLPPAAALRKAQNAVRRQPHYGPPYYWAGFVLQGDWR